MQGEIVVKQGFSVIGFAKNGSHAELKDKDIIPSLWKQINKRKHEITNSVDAHTITGICFPPRSPHYYYIAGIEVQNGHHIPEGMSVHTFPTYTYMRYHHKGPVSQLLHTYERICNEWLPASGHSLIKDGPELEIVNTRHCADPNDDHYELAIYIPIKLGS